MLAPLDGDSHLDLTIADPATLARDHVRLDVSPSLTEVERQETTILSSMVTLTAEGTAIVRPLVAFTGPLGARTSQPGDALVIDLAEHRMVARWELPAPSTDERWRVLASLPVGVLLRHETSRGLLALELFDPATGMR